MTAVVSEIELFNLLKAKIGEQEAKVLVEYVESKVEKEFGSKKDVFLTKQDKVEIIKSIYMVGLIQYLAMLASLIAIIKFLL